MMRRFARYLPFAFVVWYAKRHLARIYSRPLLVVEVFRGEVVGWRPEDDPFSPKAAKPVATPAGGEEGR